MPVPYPLTRFGPQMRLGCRITWRRRERGVRAMAMDAATIEQLIKESLPDAQVSIEDLRGDGDHYAAHVISGAFRGKTRVQQHQRVYQAVRGRMGNELHALALQTGAPED